MMYFLRHFDMIFSDSTHGSIDKILKNVLLVGMGMCNMIVFSYVSRGFDGYQAGFFSTGTASACCVASFAIFISSGTKWYNIMYKYRKYKRTLESFEIYLPTDASYSNRIRFISAFIISTFIVVTLPTNCYKVWGLFYSQIRPVQTAMFVLFYYIENFALYCTEMHFVIQCLTVRSKFQDINKDLHKVNAEIKNNCIEEYLIFECKSNKLIINDSGDGTLLRFIVYEKDFYRPKNKGNPLTNTVELLRIKHWLTREAVKDLNDLFGIRLGVSMVYLIIMTLFDIFNIDFNSFLQSDMDVIFRANFHLALCIVQYCFRFSMIVITAQCTTKQVNRLQDVLNYYLILLYFETFDFFEQAKIGWI